MFLKRYIYILCTKIFGIMHNERLLQTVGLTSSGLKGSHRSKTMGVGAINLNFPFKLCFILLKNQWHIFGIYRYCLDFKVMGFNF